MISNAISVAFNCLLILGLMNIQGCATVMNTGELPDNMDFSAADEHGHQALERITYFYPMPPIAEPEYLARMTECLDESLDYERIVLKDGSVLQFGKYMGGPYTGSHKDIVESSDVIRSVNPDTSIIEAVGRTSYPVLGALTESILRFGLTVKTGKNNDYILEFHSIGVAIKEYLKTKGFVRASNNPYQHPERIHEETRLVSEVINSCLTRGYDSKAILNALLTKAMQLDSYALDYIVEGVTVKRMYFQFSKNGKPFYRFRSEYLRDGKRYVHLVNVDGEFDYHYYPDDSKAYRVHTAGDLDESSYIAKKEWHFDYEGAQVIGEDLVNGKECYLLRKDKHTFCVWKKYGLQLYQQTDKGKLFYDNYEMQVPDELFMLPGRVTITDQ